MGRPSARYRAALIAALAAVSLASPPAAALHPVTLQNASYINSWASETVRLADEPGGRPFEPDDAPYKWSDGQVQFLLTRWDKQVCDGSRPGDVAPSIIVRERDDPDIGGDGLVVGGTVTVEPYDGGAPNRIVQPGRVVRWTVTDDAYPYGLAAGRRTFGANTQRGGGAPFEVSVRVHHRNPNGVCNSQAVHYDTIIGIDRNFPRAPTIVEPSPLVTHDTGGWAPPPYRRRSGDAFSIAAPQSGRVVVRGVAADPRTRPDADDGADFGFLETSGIAAVIVRVYTRQGRLIRSFTAENSDCDLTHVLDARVPRCSEAFMFSVDVTSALSARTWHAIDAYAIDLAGYRSPVLSTAPANIDNNDGARSIPVGFYYQG